MGCVYSLKGEVDDELAVSREGEVSPLLSLSLDFVEIFVFLEGGCCCLF